MAESFAKLFADEVENLEFKTGVIRSAEVINITPDFVVLYASGTKSESYVSIEEFKDKNNQLEVKIGDSVDVYLEAFEDGNGHTIFSRETAKRIAAWKDLEAAYEQGTLVCGTVMERVRGGFTVDVNKIKAFLPGSLVDIKPVKEQVSIEGQELDFKIIKIDKSQSNVVLSRRAALMAESTPERDALLSTIFEGAELTGTVKNLTDYGVFVDLGGIDGLLHITDISWRRIRHPNEVLTMGQEIKVKVLKYDQDKCRVSLGLKQLIEDPWKDISRRYPVGTRLFGKVTNITDYGCFIEIENGIEGLVHMSELNWTNKNLHPSKVVTLNQEVEVMVLEIDEERRRISLGVKQCRPNPWKEYALNHNKGEKVIGTIRSITDFGIFVGLEGNIDGLVHLSDLSWNEAGDKILRTYRKGQEIETVILAIDADRERISLGVKQLEQDIYSEYLENHPKGSVVSGEVTAVDPKFATVALEDDYVGRIKAVEVSRAKVRDVNEFLQVGDRIEAKILGVDKKARVVNLSIRELQPELGEDNAPVNTQLGDLLKQQMEQN